MFGRIVPRYDLLNHLLSLSFDRLWRRWTARKFQHILRRTESRTLDLCCGTGDLTFALERVRGPMLSYGGERAGFVIGADFTQPMLVRAREKARETDSVAMFLAADALSLPFADESFDLVTAAFGFRNLANYEQGLREIARVLRRGGEVGILEFAEPTLWPIAPAYRFYFRNILPRIAGAISGSKEAYAYLPGSVAKFPSPDELAHLMTRTGFMLAEYKSWTFGIVTLHSARKR